MKVRANRAELASALKVAATVAMQRTPKPILAGVLLNAQDGALAVRATDLELYLTQRVAQVQVDLDGIVVVNAQKLSDIVAAFPGDAIELELANDRLVINGGTDAGADDTFNLATMDPAGFPLQALANAADTPAQIPAGVLETMISRTAFVAASEPGKFAYNGILITAADGTITCIATDGRRLAKSVEPCSGLDTGINCIVPGATLEFLLKLIDSPEELVAIKVAGSMIQFAFAKSGAIVNASLIDGQFPPIESAYAHFADDQRASEIERDALLAAVARASILSGDGTTAFTFLSKTLTLECLNADGDDSHVEIPCKTTGGKLTIGLNAKFVAEFLKHFDGQRLRVQLPERNRPALFRSLVDDDAGGSMFEYILMPINLNATQTAATAAATA